MIKSHFSVTNVTVLGNNSKKNLAIKKKVPGLGFIGVFENALACACAQNTHTETKILKFKMRSFDHERILSWKPKARLLVRFRYF
jgi:hypothetical protein